MCHAAAVYRTASYPLPRVYHADSEEGLSIIRDGRYLRLWGHGQSMSNDSLPGTGFRLTKFAAAEAMTQESHRLYRVGLSNHAGFDGTMKYVERTGARFVLTDSTRSSGQKARALAAAITRELGVDACAATPQPTLQYGK